MSPCSLEVSFMPATDHGSVGVEMAAAEGECKLHGTPDDTASTIAGKSKFMHAPDFFLCESVAIEGGLSHATRICDLLFSFWHREHVTVPSSLLTDV